MSFLARALDMAPRAMLITRIARDDEMIAKLEDEVVGIFLGEVEHRLGALERAPSSRDLTRPLILAVCTAASTAEMRHFCKTNPAQIQMRRTKAHSGAENLAAVWYGHLGRN